MAKRFTDTAKEYPVRFHIIIDQKSWDREWRMLFLANTKIGASKKDYMDALARFLDDKQIWSIVSRFRKDYGAPPPDNEKKNKPERYISNGTKWKVFKSDGYRCVICSSDEVLEIDHIIPVSKGGTNHISNLQTLCRRCNGRKSNDF